MIPPVTTIATPNGKVMIRPGRLADAVLLTELREKALRDNPTLFGSSYEARENCTLEWSQKVLGANPHESCNFLAEYGQKILGTAGIRRYSGQKTRHSATIGGVYIRPEWRSMGIVNGLFEACLDWAKKEQITILKLAVVTSNLPALKAYQRLGFSIYGTEPKVIQYEGVYYDEYLLAREV